MTGGPPATVWATSFVRSTRPSEQLVLVTVPAEESTFVVPAELQFQSGEVAKRLAHPVASTLTEGGRSKGMHVDTTSPLVRSSETSTTFASRGDLTSSREASVGVPSRWASAWLSSAPASGSLGTTAP
jgi:hypothetical protein